MPPSSEQVTAARALLNEVCALLIEHRDDAVLVGGWVPEVLFPQARPAHVGSIDVDVALRLQRDGYARLIAILGEHGFHQGEHGYQFFKEMPLPNGRTCLARLDLLTSQRHYDTHFAGTRPDQAPEPIRGADVAFADNALVPVGDHATLRVAGIVAFLVMKSLAMHGRTNEKDAYDIHFCLEAYPNGLEALAALFHPWHDDALVAEALGKMAAKFRDEEDEGPRIVADIEQLLGEPRAIRKQQAAARVQEFIRLVHSAPE